MVSGAVETVGRSALSYRSQRSGAFLAEGTLKTLFLVKWRSWCKRCKKASHTSETIPSHLFLSWVIAPFNKSPSPPQLNCVGFSSSSNSALDSLLYLFWYYRTFLRPAEIKEAVHFWLKAQSLFFFLMERSSYNDTSSVLKRRMVI